MPAEACSGILFVLHRKGIDSRRQRTAGRMGNGACFVRLKAAFVSPHVRCFAKAATHKAVRRKAEGTPRRPVLKLFHTCVLAPSSSFYHQHHHSHKACPHLQHSLKNSIIVCASFSCHTLGTTIGAIIHPPTFHLSIFPVPPPNVRLIELGCLCIRATQTPS